MQINNVTKEQIQTYLSSKKEHKIVIMTAIVAQKSYGNEKRFFCPPPCVYLKGDAWLDKFTRKNSDDNNQVATLIGIGNSEKEMQPLILDKDLFGAAKTLFISDSDKRKNFTLSLKIFNTNSKEIGVFDSKKIKVISKPSKKKQSIKNSELCIASGSTVALFNRLRSQTVSTRYLFASDDGNFYASANQWGSFEIYLINKELNEDEFEARGGFIHYGSTVKLVCTQTGISLPPFIIRKVDKSQVLLDADDPVSQLHKCSFLFKGTQNSYLSLSQDKITQVQSNECKNESNKESINDGACWTIVGTDQIEYTWNDFFSQTNDPVSPVPIISTLRLDKSGDKNFLELFGENFTPNLKVWFDDVETDAFYRSINHMICQIPDVSNFKSNSPKIDRYQEGYSFMNRNPSAPIQVELNLVRNDGIIYSTGKQFEYPTEPNYFRN